MNKYRYDYPEITEMIGRTFISVTGDKNEDEIVFTEADGTVWEFYHEQDCCESVSIDDIEGDFSNLVGTPLLVAEESVNHGGEGPEGLEDTYGYDSCTWTFYKFGTVKGWVDVRWFGKSNGYYSERVNLRRYK